MAMSIVPKMPCQLSMAITIPQKLSIPMVVNTIAHVCCVLNAAHQLGLLDDKLHKG